MTTYIIGTRDGFNITAEIVFDTDVDVTEFDYDASTIDAYNRGDWGYVGIIVTASRDGVEGTDSVWGCEHGTMPHGWVDAMDAESGSWSVYGEDLIANAIADAHMSAANAEDGE